MINSTEIKWDKEITPKPIPLRTQLARVVEYKDLVLLLIKRDFITYYKQTIMGPLWYLVQPLCSALMYMIIFGNLARLGTDGIPQILFYFLGTMMWTYFSGTLKEVSNIFHVNKNLFGKVYFPRMVVPIATMLSLLIKFAIQMVLFLAIYVGYIIRGAEMDVTIKVVLFPVVVIWVGLMACGMGMIISSITTKYRDIALVLDFFISLLMYATPVVYPLSEVPVEWKWILMINPLCVPLETVRVCFFSSGTISFGMIIYSAIVTVLLLILGIRMFGKNERTFVDVI